jgi:hypothetical protein
MLNIPDVKKLIGDETISDQEAEQVRDECRIFAEIVFEQWLEDARKVKQSEHE